MNSRTSDFTLNPGIGDAFLLLYHFLKVEAIVLEKNKKKPYLYKPIYV